MIIVKGITLEEVRAAIAADPKAQIFYSARTCWWTHDPKHLYVLPGAHRLPCDPRGGMLFQTGGFEAPLVEMTASSIALRFLADAEANPTFYGRHGIDAFVAAHHLNCLVSKDDRRHTCGETWDEYNDAIDAAVE